MSNMKRKVTAVVVFVVAIVVIVSCGDDKKDENVTPILSCTCPIGTWHLEGEECCEANDCTCEIVAGVRVEGIAVTNRQNIDAGEFSTQITAIEDALSWLSPAKLAFVQTNIKEIRVIPGPFDTGPVVDQDVLTVEAGTFDSDIWMVLDGFAVVKVKIKAKTENFRT